MTWYFLTLSNSAIGKKIDSFNYKLVKSFQKGIYNQTNAMNTFIMASIIFIIDAK